MPIAIDTTNDASGARVTLRGRFDAHEAEAVGARLDELLDAGFNHIALDLSGVGFVDSSALAAMTTAMKRARTAGGDLRIANPSQSVRVIFELTGLDKAFDIEIDGDLAASWN